MQTVKKKDPVWRLVPAALILAGMFFPVAAVAQDVLAEENFNSYSNGNLGGQGGWAASADTVNYAEIQVVDGSGVNSTKAISNAAETRAGFASKNLSLDWGEYAAAALSIDLYRVGGTGIDSWAGLMAAGTVRGYGVRLRTADIGFRSGATGGDHVLHTDINGATLNIENGKWYRVTYEFTLADHAITNATLHNLTDGGSVQIYFGANTPAYTPEASAAPANWNQMVVRTPQSDRGIVLFDNMAVTAPSKASLKLLILSFNKGNEEEGV